MRVTLPATNPVEMSDLLAFALLIELFPIEAFPAATFPAESCALCDCAAPAAGCIIELARLAAPMSEARARR